MTFACLVFHTFSSVCEPCTDNRMPRKFKLSHRKYESQTPKPVEPPPESVLNVSVPLDVLSFNVSLPISAVVNAPAQSLKALQDRLVGARALPAGMYQFSSFVYLNSVYYSNQCLSIEGWADVSHLEGPESHLVLCRFRRESLQAPEVTLSVRVLQDFTWMLFFCGRQVLPNRCQVLGHVPSQLVSVAAVTDLLKVIDDSQVCSGNSDEKFSTLALSRKGVFKDPTGNNDEH